MQLTILFVLKMSNNSSLAPSDTLIPILNNSISLENENVDVNENIEELSPEDKSNLIK